jgi:hypothetical protein
MGCVFNVSTGWIRGRFCNYLADGRLHLIWIGLRLNLIEIEIQCRLINAIKILQVSECDQAAVAKAMGLIRSKLRLR